MKKKVIIITVIVLIILIGFLNKKDEYRIRVIASSNSQTDIALKNEIANEINNYLIDNNITKDNIKSNIEDIEKIVASYEIEYTINDTYENFPSKEINGKISSGGYYKCLLITLGEGKGKNYFSVLYPEYYNADYGKVHNGDVESHFYFLEKLKELFSK